MPTYRKDRTCWMGRVKINGTVIPEGTKFFGDGQKHGPEWRKALTWEHQRREQFLRESAQASASGLPPLEWAVSFLEYQQKRVSSGTFKEKRSTFDRFLPFLAGRSLKDINPAVAEAYLDQQHDERSGGAANADRQHLAAAWDWGQRHFLGRFPMNANPFRVVEKYPEERHDRYVPQESDFWRVVDVAQGQDKTMLLVLYHLAARKDEVFRLKWADVDFPKGRIRLYTRKTRSKEWRADWLPMTHELRGALLPWWEARPFKKAEHVFTQVFESSSPTHKPGEPFKHRRNLLHKLCKRAGVEYFDFHAIRHLRAVKLHEAGNTLRQIQKWLRHENAATTERYLKRLGVDLDNLLEAAELADRGPAKIINFVINDETPELSLRGFSSWATAQGNHNG